MLDTLIGQQSMVVLASEHWICQDRKELPTDDRPLFVQRQPGNRDLIPEGR
jgi:hypothetical protein